MNKIIKNAGLKITFLLIALMSAVITFAQESIYDYQPTGHRAGFNEFRGPFPYVVFGLAITFLAYMGYRYWKDNMVDDDHLPHHQ